MRSSLFLAASALSALLWCITAAALGPAVQPATASPSNPPPPITSDQMEIVHFSGALGVSLPPPAPIGARPSGQWVFTLQHGWLYMPFDPAYTRPPVSPGGDPLMYAYYAHFGWHWVAAPWIFGIGPQPWFGPYGWTRFAWYGRSAFGRPWNAFRVGHPSWYHNGLPWHATPPPVDHQARNEAAGSVAAGVLDPR